MRMPETAPSYLVPGFLLALWFIASHGQWLDPFLLPSPQRVAEAALSGLASGELQAHIGVSLARVLVGFATAALIGVPLGFGLGLSRGFRVAVDPTLQFLRQVPPIAWVPLFIVWFGIGEGSKQAVIIYATIFPILVNTALGVAQADASLLEVARAYCLTTKRTLLEVVVPGALPAVFAGLRLGLGNSWRALIAAEMIAASRGLGSMIWDARSMAQPEGVILGIHAIGLIGSHMDAIFVRLEALATPWRGGMTLGR